MNFLKYRYVFLILSLILIVSGIGYGLYRGFVFDIDFMGGTRLQTNIKQEFTNTEIEKIVETKSGVKPIVQQVSGGDHSVMITTTALSEEQLDKVIAGLKERYSTMDEPTIKNVQPSFGKELVESAVLAVTVSIVLILIYICIRFKTLGFIAAITAVISLIHDALMIIAIYGAFQLPINSTFVAVILTIIGYSINDTIVVYDRIRENKRKITKSDELRDTINTSVKQTMTRTLYTSFTTLATIAVVYILATIYNQPVLKEFSLPLMLGIIIGTYSSICIASSLWYIIEDIRNKMKTKKA